MKPVESVQKNGLEDYHPHNKNNSLKIVALVLQKFRLGTTAAALIWHYQKALFLRESMPTDSRVLDIIASAIQTAAIDDPRLDSGAMRPAVKLNNEDSRHLAVAAIRAIEQAGFVIVEIERKE